MLSQTSRLYYLQTRCVQKCDLGEYLSINSIGDECYASFSDPTLLQKSRSVDAASITVQR